MQPFKVDTIRGMQVTATGINVAVLNSLYDKGYITFKGIYIGGLVKDLRLVDNVSESVDTPDVHVDWKPRINRPWGVFTADGDILKYFDSAEKAHAFADSPIKVRKAIKDRTTLRAAKRFIP